MKVQLCEGDDTIITKCLTCARFCVIHGKTPADHDYDWIQEPYIVGNRCPHMIPRVEDRTP